MKPKRKTISREWHTEHTEHENIAAKFGVGGNMVPGEGETDSVFYSEKCRKNTVMFKEEKKMPESPSGKSVSGTFCTYRSPSADNHSESTLAVREEFIRCIFGKTKKRR